MKNVVGMLAAVGALALSLTAAPVVAQNSVEEFYSGKTINVITPYPPGGSYDTYSRLAAKYMGKYIPGNPDIIVQNKSGVVPTLRTFLENDADDGTNMGIFPETIAIIQATDPNTIYDVRDGAYIGSFAGVNAGFYLRKDSPAKTLEEMADVQINAGCNNPSGQSYLNPAMLKNLKGYKINLICGYSGNREFPPAMLKGEVDMVAGNWTGWKNRPEFKDGTFKVILQSGLRRHPDLKDVPLVQEIMDDPTSKKIVEFWSAGSAIGRALLVRATIPQERIDALRAAFDQMMTDPDLLAEAAKTNIDIDPTPGVEVQAITKSLLDAPPDLVKLAVEAVK